MDVASKTWRSSFSASVIGHVAVMALVMLWAAHAPRVPITAPKKLTYIEMLPMPPSKATRIVQTAPGLTTPHVAPDAYLGERSQSVDRETVSRRTNSEPAPVGGPQKPAMQRHAKAKAKSKPLPALSKLGVRILPQAANPDRKPSDAEPSPTASERAWAEYGKTPHEYVPGAHESDRTLLNTKEFIFFGYYQRIRERLDRAWVPILRSRVEQLYKRGRQLASEMEHTTRVLVTLDQKGDIIKVSVLSESGTRDLDDAAVSAFNQAGPFPNPPKGMVDSSGSVQIPWEFILRT